ncbi:hypothetical protein V8J82_14555 [Gymnodinialimonas sp. 2305UL16-5]
MKAFLNGAFIALVGPFALLFRPVRQQLNPIPVRIDDQRTRRHER